MLATSNLRSSASGRNYSQLPLYCQLPPQARSASKRRLSKKLSAVYVILNVLLLLHFRSVPGRVLCKFVLLKFTMASQTQGIQQLLAAEKKAAERVAEARKRKLELDTRHIHQLVFKVSNVSMVLRTGKAKRLKQAKDEAQTEMDRYRIEREKQFKQYEQMVR